MRTINTVDLFCGAGGATTGLELALKRLGMKHTGLAINHWAVAVDTMQKNHPDIETKRMSIEEAVPADLVPSGEVDLLWASPSCTHHSRAKGGKPRSNQLRAQPELVLTWLDQLHVRHVIIENVPEFVEWGPLSKDGRPIKRLIGSCFNAWVEAIRARNYIVEWRVVNCADYGDATTRRRFFLKAVKRGCGRIRWPEPTHTEHPQPDLFGTRKPWRGIKECIDFSDTGTSIFNRKKPLAANTLRRISVGLRKFCGLDFQMDMLGAGEGDESRVRPLSKPMRTQHTANRTAIVRPFIVKLRNHEGADSTEKPLSTITSGGNHHALCTPFVFTQQTNNAPRSVDAPIRAQTTVRKDYICTPLVLGQQGGAECRPVDKPCPTIATAGAVRLVTPILVPFANNGVAQGVDKPIGTQTTKDRFSLVTPFVIDNANGGTVVDPDKPMNTVTTKDNHMAVMPFVMDMSHPKEHDGRRVSPASSPMKTATTRCNLAIVNPLIFGRDACAQCRPMAKPMPTLTTGGCMRGVFPMLADGRIVDIRIRMLKPSELAAAHSFPEDYILTGNRGDQVKQIGNSVPVETAAAMCGVDLEHYPQNQNRKKGRT